MLRYIIPVSYILLSTVVLHAADANAVAAAEKRLRDTLKSTMLQLRTAETERATLQAAQAESEQKNQTLTAEVAELNKKIEGLIKQSSADKEAAGKVVAGLNNRITDQELELTRLKESLDKWKAGYKQVSEVASSKESQRAALASQVVILNRELEDRTAKNIELFKIGSEILTRYEKFGLGTALTAREPFVGTTRVKIQSLVQDYQDKLVDQKIKLPASTENKTATPKTSVGKPQNGKLPPSEAQPETAQAEPKSEQKTKP